MTLGHTETGVQHRTHTPPKKQHEGTPIYVCVIFLNCRDKI